MRVSISRHETSARLAPRHTLTSAAAVSAPHRRRERRSRPRGPGVVWGLRCKAPPFSRMCARMRNHSTASPAPCASPAPAALIGIGVNLAHGSYDADRDAVIARAQAAGVVQMLITGSSLAGTQRALALARAHPLRLFATAGVHPHHAAELTAQRAAELEDLARQPEVVAVGECGLDYFRDFSPRAAQRQAFHRQLELAARVGKPVFLHQREPHAEFAAILPEHGAAWRGAGHCFTGSGEGAAWDLQLWLLIGMTARPSAE